MSVNNLPFAKLRRLLLDLGFTEHVIDGKYLGFTHAESGCFFALPIYGRQERVSSTDLAGVRPELDLRGLLSEEAFDAALKKGVGVARNAEDSGCSGPFRAT
jgi:hypothetical protein